MDPPETLGYPMIQLMICVTRLESVSPEEFRRNWKEVQGPAVRGLVETLGASGATQALTLEVERNETIRDKYRTAEPFDGVICLQFESTKDLLDQVGNPGVAADLMQLYQQQVPFIDLTRTSVFYTEAPVELSAINPYRRDSGIGDYVVEEEDPDGG